MTAMLTLTVEVDGESDRTNAELLNTVRLLAPHVDLVRVNTTGIGHGLADQLRHLGPKLQRFSPAALEIVHR